MQISHHCMYVASSVCVCVCDGTHFLRWRTLTAASTMLTFLCSRADSTCKVMYSNLSSSTLSEPLIRRRSLLSMMLYTCRYVQCEMRLVFIHWVVVLTYSSNFRRLFVVGLSSSLQGSHDHGGLWKHVASNKNNYTYVFVMSKRSTSLSKLGPIGRGIT